jgi:hypothetical protein
MRRNGRTSGRQSSAISDTNSSGLLKAGLALLGGAGLGAGLLFLLDPDKGQRRRRGIVRGVSSLGSGLGHSLSNIGSTIADTAGNWGSTASEYAGSAARSLRHARDSASDYAGETGGYFSDKYNRARALWDDDLVVEDKWQRRLGFTVCSLGSMVLGATLMYLLDPVAGRNRRNQIGQYARSAGESVSDYARSAGETVSEYTRKASDAVRSGTNYVTDGVKNMTGMGRGENQSNTTGSDIGMATAPSNAPTTLSDLAGTVCPPESSSSPSGNLAM